MKNLLIAEVLALSVAIPTILVATVLGRWIFG